MRRANILHLFGVLAVSLFFANSMSAQPDTLVEISNNSGEKRKICIYKDGDSTGLVPNKCFVMNAWEKVVWNRDYDTSYFQVKVFKTALIDKLLTYRRLPGRTTSIVMGSGTELRYTEAAIKAAATKYRLKVCNERFNESIFFSLSFETNEQFLTEGWWSVIQGQCHEFPVSERLSRILKLEYGHMPRIYYYAQTFVANPMYWTGGPNGLPLCVKDGKKFTFKQRRGVGGNPMPGACNSSDQRRVSFRPIDAPKANEVYYYLTF